MNKKINIILASDENYVKLLVPCIVSILYNKKPTTEIDIYILESEISEYSKQKIKELEHFNNINNCKITFINTVNIIKENINIVEQKKYTLAIIYKLFIPKLFSQLNKVLWLDADIIVRCDLLELYNQDLNEYCLASPMFNFHFIEDGLDRRILYEKELLNIRDIVLKMNNEINPNSSNLPLKINGGVILFNIHQILNNNQQDQLINIALKYKNHIPLIDEESLSIVFQNKIKNVSGYYNYCPINKINYNAYNMQEKINYKNNLEHVKIIHYINIKPHILKKLYKLTYYKEFYKYYQMSYLKINPIKLKLLFWLNELKAFRRSILGIKEMDKHNRVFYIGKLSFKFWERSHKNI